MSNNDLIRRGQALERLELAEHDAEERDWRSGANEIARLRKYVAAIPAVQPTVKPLVWHDCHDGTSHDDDCQYEIERDGKYWKLRRGVTGGTSYLRHADTLEAAKAAAQSDYDSRILSALDMQPTVSPDVEALVEALENLLIAIGMGWDLDGVVEVSVAALARVKGVM